MEPSGRGSAGLLTRRAPAPPILPPGGEVPAPSRRWARTAVAATAWGLMGFGTVLVVAVSVMNVLGFRSLVVMSGSMAPVLHPGDLVIDRRVTPLRVRTGDVVTFRDPTDPKRLITHRVRDVRLEADAVELVTKGDASNSVQRWSIRPDGTMGRVIFRIPMIGYLIFWARSRVGVLAVLILPSLILGAHLLVRIWRPSRARASHAHSP